MSAKLFLIDAHALCYSSFYAIKELTNSRGQATNAVYGFINTVRKILRDYQPDYMAVCFDSKVKTHRQAVYAEYKIQRPVMPTDLISQIPIIKDVVTAYNLVIFEVGGYEADDIIATLAKKASQENIEVVIVSEDKDMYQLAKKNIKFLSTRKDELLGTAEVKERLGFDPHKIIDFIALAGDNIDNIPGVKGIGEVTARNLIEEFGDLDNLLKNIEKIKSEKLREKIVQDKQSAIMSRDLAVLECDVPLEFDLKDLEVKSPNRAKLFEMFKELEFRRLAEEFSTRSPDEVSLKTISSDEEVKDLIKHIKQKGQFAFVFESAEEIDKPGVFIALSEEDSVYYLESVYLPSLKEVLGNKDIRKITHNLKDSLKIFSQYDLTVEGSGFDVLLAAYLLSASQGAFEISDLAWQYFKSSLT